MDDHSTIAVVRRLILVIVTAIIMAMGIVARADSIRLHDRISASGPTVTMSEVAEMEGPAAQRFADTVVTTFDSGDKVRVSLDSVRRTLTDAGANWGLLSLGGYQSCEVHRAVEASPVPEASPAELALANVEDEVTLETPGSLRALIVDRLSAFAGVDREDLRLTFQDRDAALLASSVVGKRYEVEPLTTSAIGRVPLVLRRYEEGRVAETLHVKVDVERRIRALVVTRTISRGEALDRGSVELREVYLDQDRGEPLTDAALLRGQSAASLMREGHVVYAEDVASPVLVQRGELVTVRCLSGRLVVRTVGRAGQNGRDGELIQVRNDSTRETYLATVTGSREVTVRMDEDRAEPVAVNTGR